VGAQKEEILLRRALRIVWLLLLLPAVSASASPQFFTRHDIHDDFNGARSIYATDVDGDGDIDVLSAAYYNDQICWWENTGGTPPTFVQHYIRHNFDGAHSVYAADLDSDGDTDVLGAAAAGSLLTWWENKPSGNEPPADPISWTEHSIDGSYGGAICVYATDIDGDDDLDVVSASNWEDDITFWQNAPSGNPSNPISWTERTLRGDFEGAISVFAADVDGDGNTDVLGTARDGDEIAWWENSGGAAPSFTEHSIRDDLDWALCVYAADLDGDADVDVLGCGHTDDDLLWWENIPSGNAPPLDPVAWVQHTIDEDFDGVDSAYIADVDDDGNMDIVSAAYWADEIAWYENDGDETFVKHAIEDGFDGAYWVHVADVDGDADLDVLPVADKDDDVTWWENTTTVQAAPLVLKSHWTLAQKTHGGLQPI
jgi:hypothetical protein